MTPFAGPPSGRRRAGAPWGRPVLLGLLTVLALGMGASPALAHDGLTGSTPAASAALTAVPSEVQLEFSGAPQQLGTRVVVTGPGGTVSTGEPEIRGTTVVQALSADLPAGAYRVQWRATSSDGHPIEGNYGFSVSPDAAPAAPVTPQPAAASTGTGTPGVWWAAGALVLVALGTVVAGRLRRRA
ncbi:copper resistance CopC family protein [Modestobacter roseus]|uniref:copper resistance CopC family protein n=1 Tax=Modestobacter roseus TaxID=1181884 RepID=UPI0034DFFA0C